MDQPLTRNPGSTYHNSLNKSASIELFRAYQSENKSQGLQQINNQYRSEGRPAFLRPADFNKSRASENQRTGTKHNQFSWKFKC